MTTWLLRLVDWYLARRDERRLPTNTSFLAVSAHVRRIAATAIPLIEAMDAKPFRGGYKRRQVEAKLFRLYPASAKVDVALAIEVAIRQMRGL